MIVIFDWDGTLCDSVEQIVQAMQAAAETCALPVPEAAAVRHIIGLSLVAAMPLLFPGTTAAQQEAMQAAYASSYQALDPGPARLHEGALETLEWLRSAGFELAVATGKSRRGLDRVLKGLGMETYFQSTRCADETRSKPHPMMLEEILAARGKTVHNALMVGDSAYDLDMAQRIGMASVGVTFGVHSREQLSQHQPVALIDRLEALRSVPQLAAQASTG
ncbi:MAG TPA: HAD family hydrolase [Halieaceae bacterium]|jgi:phosphoglycolate phosphatase|uniref:HAD-IA family hydrolase n=1 Tax=Haliea TaxID=475794 RepID=UPI000C39AAD3|nr:HAD-IA family hydrolase [Haliea sp.]MAD64422.1 HAD family hydrolase [Haliea sp.]MAY91700.1 HAD family hydrolase [Haliea sp.]MBP70426.1 HAD family hydrolase [Haliea sp.]HBQ41301.1 HAD family hydrolase [Halieaceae bacterium]|tara:strand:+ start:700 stop:1359 length:660 start_codon:yes stop_codon:yes gene_type:complete